MQFEFRETGQIGIFRYVTGRRKNAEIRELASIGF